MVNVKFLTGSKEGIDAKIASGDINAGDVIFTADTDEIIFMNPALIPEKRVIKSKSQQDYTLQGVELGDLSEGDIISSGVDIDTLLSILTKKTIAPEYKTPEIELTSSLEESLFEVGTPISFMLKSQFIQNDAGEIISHKIFNHNEEIYNKTNATINLEINNLLVPEGEIKIVSKVFYGEGIIKNNNFNKPSLEGRIEAGELVSEPLIYKGCRRMFFESNVEKNIKSIRDFKYSFLNPQKNQEIEVIMNANDQHVTFAYPASLGDVQEITYLQLNDDMTSNFEQTSAFVEGANGYEAVEYKVYSYSTAAPIASKMTFKVII
jgi:hypothetical protein